MHHRDPFDRLLVAQAEIEGIALITADIELSDYGVDIVW
jgi:PIN domain nuclease of toxin-antitoxin system